MPSGSPWSVSRAASLRGPSKGRTSRRVRTENPPAASFARCSIRSSPLRTRGPSFPAARVPSTSHRNRSTGRLASQDVRHGRGQEATTQVLMRRLLALDYVIERPTLGWLPTEAEKVQRFEALGIDRGVLPYRTCGEDAKAQKRFVALKCPVAVDEKMATFTYVDPGLTTDSELRAWGVVHAPLWAALLARSFAVHVVRDRHGRTGGTTRRARAETLDARRRWAGRDAPRRADPGRPGHPPRNRPARGSDHRRQSSTLARGRRVRQGGRSS